MFKELIRSCQARLDHCRNVNELDDEMNEINWLFYEERSYNYAEDYEFLDDALSVVYEYYQNRKAALSGVLAYDSY